MISILIVEDEAPIRELLRISLKEAGYECTCAGDGDEAADILIQKRFDLVLLDIMLPGANGYELLEFVRPMEIPVIFLTAKGEVADKVKGLRMGAEDYITKPFEQISQGGRDTGVRGGQSGSSFTSRDEKQRTGEPDCKRI